jgi:hypothetical protein
LAVDDWMDGGFVMHRDMYVVERDVVRLRVARRAYVCA